MKASNCLDWASRSASSSEILCQKQSVHHIRTPVCVHVCRYACACTCRSGAQALLLPVKMWSHLLLPLCLLHSLLVQVICKVLPIVQCQLVQEVGLNPPAVREGGQRASSLERRTDTHFLARLIPHSSLQYLEWGRAACWQPGPWHCTAAPPSSSHPQ